MGATAGARLATKSCSHDAGIPISVMPAFTRRL